MSEVFPPAFLDTLHRILARMPRLPVRREDAAAGRRRFSARSGTFAGHRAYTVGDDLRYVDWNAYARTGELFVKLLEEDERRTLTLLVDRTPSMVTAPQQRLVGALRVAAILGGLALVRLDGVRVVAGGSEVHALAGAAALPRLIGLLAGLRPAAQDPLELARLPLELGWLGRIAWISDFAEPDAFGPALHQLRRHGRRCTGWLPTLGADRAPELGGWLRLVDPETGAEQVFEVDAALRAAVREELELLARRQDAVFRTAGAALVRFALPAEGDFGVRAWFEAPWTSRL